MKAIDVARHFLFLARSFDAGDTISNLKMQKMLYYAQGWHLALTSKELFGDEIEAWQYGPVVKSVYDEFRKYGKNSIDFSELDSYKQSLSDETAEFLAFIFDETSRIPAWELVKRTHQHKPYIDNYSQIKTNIIPKNEIKAFFNEQILQRGDEVRKGLGL